MIRILISIFLSILLTHYIYNNNKLQYQIIHGYERCRLLFLSIVHSDNWLFKRILTSKALFLLKELNIWHYGQSTKGYRILFYVEQFDHALAKREWKYLRNKFIDWDRISSILYDPKYEDPWPFIEGNREDINLPIYIYPHC